MSGVSSSPAPRPRNSEDNLYQACLDACIDGIGKLQVDKRCGIGAKLKLSNNTSNKLNLTSAFLSAATSPVKPEPAASLPSPPQSPVNPSIPQPTSPLVQSPASTTVMNRSMLHGAPPRGAPPSAFGHQDARSNLAVQPAANAGSLKLKKNAVKIVGAAGPMSNAPPRPTAPAPTMAPSAPRPVKAKPKEADGYAPAKPVTTPATPPLAPRPAVSKIETSKQNDTAESALDTLFSRLTTQSRVTPSHATEDASPPRPDKAMFSFEDRPSTAETPIEILQSVAAKLPIPSVKPKQSAIAIATALPENKTEPAKKIDQLEDAKDIKQEDYEYEYLGKASDYVNALPAGQNATVQTIKAVSKKLRSSYIPDVQLDTESNEALKARYVFAVANYVNRVLKKGARPLTVDLVKAVMKGNDGNFLGLCAFLVGQKYMALENLDDVTGLCKTILDILPKAESGVTIPTTTPTTTSSVAEEARPISSDPVDKMTAWPTQEKRDNAATYRTCVLKGVSGVTSINQLQALVWGGRIESISMPETGSDFALVKFLTPEACQKYFEDTENGIEVGGDKKTVIFVEKTAGPNSINDVIRNCIEGDASRCVRAVGCEDDWSDMMLMKLARGKGQSKREVDRIKRGKTARDHNFVEFRFANILHALKFKRQLMDDADWEPCNISYAPDPCETARGVHYKDEDE